MQNQYFGDIGDYAKYGLLRIFAQAGLSLGVHWYLVPNGLGNPNDGKHVRYLEQPERFRACDAKLFDFLGRCVRGGRRYVRQIETSGLLPASFWSEPLTFDDLSRPERETRRQRWTDGALAATRQAELVFVDPDNGLEVRAGPLSKNGPKYVYYDELRRFFGRGQSLLVYHHLGRTDGTHRQQIATRRRELRRKLGAPDVFALHARRASARIFFVVPQARHVRPLRQAGERLVSGPWAVAAKPLFEPELIG